MLTIPLLLVATAWFKRNIKASFQDVREQVSQLNTFVQEHIVGMNIVQIFNRENAEFKKIDTDGFGSILFDEFCEWAISQSLKLDEN